MLTDKLVPNPVKVVFSVLLADFDPFR